MKTKVHKYKNVFFKIISPDCYMYETTELHGTHYM